MNNKNLGIAIAVVIIAAAALYFFLVKEDKKETVAAEAPQTTAATVEPAAAEATTPVEPQATADNPVVGTVDGKKILRSEVIAFMRNLPPQMQQLPVESVFPMALEQVVTAKVVDEKSAKYPELQSDPEVARRLGEAKIQIVRTVFLEREIEKQLSESRLQKAYDKFKSTQEKVEEVHARHILVADEATAKEIIAKLEAGGKFEELAKQYSKDPSNKDTGGDLGYFAKDAMVKEFADAAFSLGTGSVSKTPVKTQFGYHVIQVIDKRNRPVPTYEQIKQALAADERRQILNEIVEGWRKKADVTTFDVNGNPIVKKPDAPSAQPAQ